MALARRAMRTEEQSVRSEKSVESVIPWLFLSDLRAARPKCNRDMDQTDLTDFTDPLRVALEPRTESTLLFMNYFRKQLRATSLFRISKEIDARRLPSESR